MSYIFLGLCHILESTRYTCVEQKIMPTGTLNVQLTRKLKVLTILQIHEHDAMNARLTSR